MIDFSSIQWPGRNESLLWISYEEKMHTSKENSTKFSHTKNENRFLIYSWYWSISAANLVDPFWKWNWWKRFFFLHVKTNIKENTINCLVVWFSMQRREAQIERLSPMKWRIIVKYIGKQAANFEQRTNQSEHKTPEQEQQQQQKWLLQQHVWYWKISDENRKRIL